MLFLSIVHQYLIWHYSRGLLEIFHVWLNLLWFVFYFFSLPQLMNSWFSPWKRIVEKRKITWNLEDIAGVIIIGMISRITGFIIRTIIIFIGLVCLFITILGGLATYVFWVAAPLIIISLLGLGVTLLIA
jgi:hypothetical protein